MELRHVPLNELKIAAVNMRDGRRPPDISDILPSVRARGILQPLLVRPNGEGFEIIAGRRRYFAAKTVAGERGEIAALPCAVMDAGDDAAALEASLIENVARLDADEVSQWGTFVKMTKAGKTVADIAATFGLTERMVKGRLALGNLLPKIREAYRREELDAETVRYLTLASKSQQKDWLTLFEGDDGNAPFGSQLKQWLFGGQSIATKVALFPVESYQGQIVADLFGEDAYFGDADLFWTLQNQAIAAQRDALLAEGWVAVDVLDVGETFAEWQHTKTPKKKGGHVFIATSHRGEVSIHVGWLTQKDARRSATKEAADGADEGTVSAPNARPAMTKIMENYIALHRHAAARLALMARPDAAYRLLIAHAIAASGNWQVKADAQQARSNEIKASVAASPAQQAFAQERGAIAALLGLAESDGTVSFGNGDSYRTATVFARLLAVSEDDLNRIAAFVMAETLAAGSAVVEAMGTYLKVDASAHWQADETFFELLREKATVNAMLSEVAGKEIADANLAERAKVQKQVIRDSLSGTHGRVKVEAWLPGWMAFPFRGYGDGTCGIAQNASSVADLFPEA